MLEGSDFQLLLNRWVAQLLVANEQQNLVGFRLQGLLVQRNQHARSNLPFRRVDEVLLPPNFREFVLMWSEQ